jgi:hypothetical protein
VPLHRVVVRHRGRSLIIDLRSMVLIGHGGTGRVTAGVKAVASICRRQPWTVGVAQVGYKCYIAQVVFSARVRRPGEIGGWKRLSADIVAARRGSGPILGGWSATPSKITSSRGMSGSSMPELCWQQ